MAFQLSRELEIFRRLAKPKCPKLSMQQQNIANSQIRPASTGQSTRAVLRRGDQRSRSGQLGNSAALNEVDTLVAGLFKNRSSQKPIISNSQQVTIPEPYHLNVYSTKHNTHITWTRPNRDPIISISAGNLNFKKANRGKYDAAYQLTTFMMTKMQERGLLDMMGRSGNPIGIELILRGFGLGREAFTKALMSPEGRVLKDYIVRVTDATRLKFGGTRSRNVRRL